MSGLLAASATALWLAADAGVKGPAAVPDTLRGAFAAAGLFALCGYAPARVLTPRALSPYLALLVLPFGAASSAFALTVLGFLQVPLEASLPIVLAAGAVSALLVRWRGGSVAVDASAAAGSPGVRLLLPAYVALLVVAVALIPTMRNGYATVVGQNGDAELAVAVTEFLQSAGPTEIREDLAIDRMPGVWRSKYPIYYSLAGVSRLSGLEPYQVFATQMAVLLGLVSIAFFLFARVVLGAATPAALLAMALVPLDRILMYVTIHPFHNQIWGTLALVLTLVFGLEFLREPTRRAAVAFALFGALAAFAYPLVLWMPVLVMGVAAFVIARRRRAEGRPVGWLSSLRLPRGRRSLALWGPLALISLPFLLVLVTGVVEKSGSALSVLAPGSDLTNWRGADGFLPFPRFFGIPGESVLSHVAALAVICAAALSLRGRPREVALPLAALGAVALAVAAYFRARTFGDLFFFKDLAFVGGFVVAGAVVWLVETASEARRARRAAASLAAVALAAACVAGTRAEIADTYDLLNKDLLELREWGDRVPAGASILLDLPPDGYQLWTRHMLHEHPLSTTRPLVSTIFPSPPAGLKADYVLGGTRAPRPRGAAGEPLFENGSYRLYEMAPTVPGPDTSSRALIDASSASFDD